MEGDFWDQRQLSHWPIPKMEPAPRRPHGGPGPPWEMGNRPQSKGAAGASRLCSAFSLPPLSAPQCGKQQLGDSPGLGVEGKQKREDRVPHGPVWHATAGPDRQAVDISADAGVNSDQAPPAPNTHTAYPKIPELWGAGSGEYL